MLYDVFICHASEDKSSFVTPLAGALKKLGLEVWYDEYSLKLGDPLRRKIDEGLSSSRYGVVVLSQSFFNKKWTQEELDALFSREISGEKVILPIWHKIDMEYLVNKAPMLAGRLAVSSDTGIDYVAEKIIEAVKPSTLKEDQERLDDAYLDRARWLVGKLLNSSIKQIPNVWRVSSVRNKNFRGRVEILNDLMDGFSKGIQIQILTGPPGVGKTEIALEYAYKFSANYSLIWWVQCENRAVLESNYSSLALKLFPDVNFTVQDQAIIAVREYLERTSSWLIIFDNVEKVSSIAQYLPQSAFGNVIVTSSNIGWRALGRTIEVGAFCTKESLDFLASRTELPTDSDAVALADALWHFPLALEQACSFIEATGYTYSRYLMILSSEEQYLLDYPLQSVVYRKPFISTYRQAVGKVRALSSIAAEILNFLSFLAPQDIPDSLVFEYAKRYLDDSNVQKAFYDARWALGQFSLVKFSGDSVHIHGLVQLAVRHFLNVNEQVKVVEEARLILDSILSFAPNDKGALSSVNRIIPHVLAIIEYAEHLEVINWLWAGLFGRVGAYFHVAKADMRTARKFFKRAIELSPDDANNQATAQIMYNYGQFLNDEGKFVDAKEYLEKALTTHEWHYGKESEVCAEDSRALAGVYRNLGDFAKAQTNAERSLEFYRKNLDKGHPNVIRAMNTLANILRDRKRLEEAVDLLTEAISLTEDDLLAAKLSNNKGLFLIDLNRLQEAQDILLQSKNTITKKLGCTDPWTANLLNNLGRASLALKDFQTARDLFSQALFIDYQVESPIHPRIAVRLCNLGEALFGLGELHSAKEHFEKAESIFERDLTANVMFLKMVYEGLAKVHQLLRNESFAVYYQNKTKALNEEKESLGTMIPHIGRSN